MGHPMRLSWGRTGREARSIAFNLSNSLNAIWHGVRSWIWPERSRYCPSSSSAAGFSWPSGPSLNNFINASRILMAECNHLFWQKQQDASTSLKFNPNLAWNFRAIPGPLMARIPLASVINHVDQMGGGFLRGENIMLHHAPERR